PSATSRKPCAWTRTTPTCTRPWGPSCSSWAVRTRPPNTSELPFGWTLPAPRRAGGSTPPARYRETAGNLDWQHSVPELPLPENTTPRPFPPGRLLILDRQSGTP